MFSHPNQPSQQKAHLTKNGHALVKRFSFANERSVQYRPSRYTLASVLT